MLKHKPTQRKNKKVRGQQKPRKIYQSPTLVTSEAKLKQPHQRNNNKKKKKNEARAYSQKHADQKNINPYEVVFNNPLS